MKKGRWYTDEERVLGIWSNPSIHLPMPTMYSIEFIMVGRKENTKINGILPVFTKLIVNLGKRSSSMYFFVLFYTTM